MPPKTNSTNNTVSGRDETASNPTGGEVVRDQWSANPFRSTDPRREQYEVQQRINQRKAAVSRVGHAIAKDLRTHDFAKKGVVLGLNTTSAEFASATKNRFSAADTGHASRGVSIAATEEDGNALTRGGYTSSRSTSVQGLLTQQQHHTINNDADLQHKTNTINTYNASKELSGVTAASIPDLTTVPSKLKAPSSYVEEALSVEGLTCSVVLQGGSLVLVGTRSGHIVALNGFTNDELARVSVEEPIQRCDNELAEVARQEGGDPNRRPQRKARRGDAEAHSIAMGARLSSSSLTKADTIVASATAAENNNNNNNNNLDDDEHTSQSLAQTQTFDDTDALRGTTRRDPNEKSGNVGAFPIAVGALGESSFVAFVLSNRKVRVFDAMSLQAVDEICYETESEREEGAAIEADNDNNKDSRHKKDNDEGGGDEDVLPFAAVLPVDCASDPVIFFVACVDRVVSFNLYQPTSLAERPRLVITRIKTYEKLGLRLVSAATDSARTVVYAGDDAGGVWSIDVGDLMVVDSWPAVPPPPAPPNTKREQRRAAAAAANRLAAQQQQHLEGSSAAHAQQSDGQTKGAAVEMATAVGAFKEYIFVGTSAGRVVVSQKQPYGEKPLTILDEEDAHKGRIIGAVADERAETVWFASELGEITCWDLTGQRLVYRTVVPTFSSPSESRSQNDPSSAAHQGVEEDKKKTNTNNNNNKNKAALLTSFAMLPHAITNKIWAITISGINKVWVTEDHQTHDEMGVAHTHMEAILNRQELAMQQKEEEVEAAERTMLDRLQKIVDAIAEQNRQRLLRAYYCAWVTVRLKAITRRKREDAAEALNNNAVYRLARSYYLKLIANMTSRRERKQNEATIAHLRTQREDELRGRYFNSLRKYVHERRAAEHKTILAVAVAGINSASTMTPFFFDKWRRFADARRKTKLQKKYLELISKVEGRRLALSFFLRWQKAVSASRLLVEQRRTVSIIADSGRFRSLRGWFTLWESFLAQRKAQRQRMRWCAFAMRVANQKLLSKAFDALLRHRLVKMRARKIHEVMAAEKRKAELEKDFATVAPVVDRREKLKALHARIALLKSQREALAKDEAAVSSHNTVLREQILQTPNPIIERLEDALLGGKSRGGATTSSVGGGSEAKTSPSDEPLSVPPERDTSSVGSTVKDLLQRRLALLKLFGRLRGLIVNLERDAAAINRVLSKAKADSVMGTFDSYVSDLKATINLLTTSSSSAEISSIDHHGGHGGGGEQEDFIPTAVSHGKGNVGAGSLPQWPKSESALIKLVADADSLQGPLLLTIKAIVVAFDALSPAEVNALAQTETARDLIDNGDTLVLLSELLQQATGGGSSLSSKRKTGDSPPPSPSKGMGTPRTRLTYNSAH